MDIGKLYRESRSRIGAFVRESGPDVGQICVAACPGWTVADVIAHLVGGVEDAVAGRLKGPPPPAEQTTDQVNRHHGESLGDMISLWDRLGPGFESVLCSNHVVPAFLDVLSHECDIANALGRSADRDEFRVKLAAQPLSKLSDPAIRIDLVDDVVTPAPSAPGTWILRTTPFECFRLRLGRRSIQQVRAMSWSCDPEPILDRLFIFGPSLEPIGE